MKKSAKTLIFNIKITKEDREITNVLQDKYSINVSSLLRNTLRNKYNELEKDVQKE